MRIEPGAVQVDRFRTPFSSADHELSDVNNRHSYEAALASRSIFAVGE